MKGLIELCLNPGVKADILRLFVSNPNLRLNQAQIAANIHQTEISVSRSITDLHDLQILHLETHGRSKVFSLNQASYIVTHFLNPILKLESEFVVNWVGKVMDGLPKSLSAKIAQVLLFGSAARGEMEPRSDIDLLIIMKTKKKELATRVADEFLEKAGEHALYVSLQILNKGALDKDQKAPFLKNALKEGIKVWNG